MGFGRKVVAADEIWRDGVAVGGQIVQQTTETDQVTSAGLVRQRGILIAQPAEPTKHMGIAAELGRPAYLRKRSVEIGEESVSHATIVSQAVSAQSQGEGLEVRFKDLIEAECGLFHKIYEEPKVVRFAMAREYSRQTS